jgi:hypothetical protein
MLDYFKALLSSSHFNLEEIRKIKNGKLITQQKILETLLLYIYSEMNKENTYLMNLYEDDDIEEEFHNLFRIRLLQTIMHFGNVNNNNKLEINYSKLAFLLEKFGYGKTVKSNLSKTLKMMQDFAIIETSSFGANYNSDTDIILNDSAYYYVNNLIYTYRYLETIIPDTHLDYRANLIDLKGNLRSIDREIEKFIDFIKRLEEKEPSIVAEKFGQAISERMTHGFIEDRERQKKSQRK